MAHPIRVLLVDDHELVRFGMRQILRDHEDLHVVGECGSGEDAVAWFREGSADVVLMDVKMPGIGGIEATRKLKRSNPEVRVIAVTVLNEEPFPNQLLEAGAWGYLSKGCPATELMAAIRDVHGGEQYLSQEVARRIAVGKITGSSPDQQINQLSQREMQVMLMITQGKSTSEISDALILSPKTVSTYRYRLYSKLGVSNDVELTHFAIRHGLHENAS